MDHKYLNEYLNKIKKWKLQRGKFDSDVFWYTHLLFTNIEPLQKKFFGKYIPFIIIYQDKSFYFLLPTTKLLDFGEEIYNNYTSEDIKNKFYHFYERALMSFRRLIKEKDLQEEIYKNFINEVQKFTAFSVNSLEALETYLNHKLNNEINNQKIKDLLITPLYDPYILKQQLELIKIIKDLPSKELNEIKKGKVSKKDTPIFMKKISEHFNKWKWVNLNYLSHTYSTQKVFIKQAVQLAKNLNEEIHKMEELKKRKKKKLLYLKRSTTQVRKLINYMDILYELKDRRKEFYIKTALPFKIWLKKIGKRHNTSYEELRWTTFEEQIKISKGIYSSSEIKDIIKKRKKCTVLLFDSSNKCDLIEGNTALKLRQYLLQKQKKAVLKGIQASPGYVVGKAIVINSKEEIGNFKEGNILVSSHTTPDFLPIMKKATAILTERGGLTSHAAIVSRELSIPCVVGIVGLLDNIKTGDYLEVNASKGIVSKLSKEKYEEKFEEIKKQKTV